MVADMTLKIYIYLWENDPDIHYRIENLHHSYIKSFYKILDKHNLPGIMRETRIQFIVKNIRSVMYGRIINLTWRDIHCSIKEDFSEIADLSSWSNLYVFIKKEEFSEVIENIPHLESIKKYCYEKAKKHDVNGILSFKEFHIRIDNYENYQSIGGQHYFNSDLMFDCLLF